MDVKLFRILVCNKNQISFFLSFFSFKGITNIVNIPLNTTRVHLTQYSSKKDRYYLAVKYINGSYILNGLHSLQLYNSKIRIGSATLFYSGSDSNNESILITGRLRIPLEIQVISIYQTDLLPTEVYWEYYIENDHCDRPCQGFKQVKKCILYDREYDLNYCLIFKISFKYKQERCNTHCILTWTKKYQQSCSTRCSDGYKYVMYECTKISSRKETIDEDVCRKYIGEKSKDFLPCVGDCAGIGWVYGNWSEVCIEYLL
jgi:hypothetical protein